MRQHEYYTRKHEYNTTQHETTRDKTSTTRDNTSTTRDNTSTKQPKIYLGLLVSSLYARSLALLLGSKARFTL